MGFVANFIRFPGVQKFRKSVKIWQSYRAFKGGNFFWDTVYMLSEMTHQYFTSYNVTTKHLKAYMYEWQIMQLNVAPDARFVHSLCWGFIGIFVCAVCQQSLQLGIKLWKIVGTDHTHRLAVKVCFRNFRYSKDITLLKRETDWLKLDLNMHKCIIINTW